MKSRKKYHPDYHGHGYNADD